MESTRFDDLARGLTRAATRRRALVALAAGALTLGLGGAAARADEVTPLDCRPKSCNKKPKGKSCKKDKDCCLGLVCKGKKCQFKNSHGGPGDWCKSSSDCNNKFYCKKHQCLPDECKS